MRPLDGVLAPTPAPRESASSERAVATEFEALMLRGMVEAMHRSSQLGDEETGGQLVDHLIVDALAGHLAKAGGIGLAELVVGAEREPHRVPSTEGQLGLERWLRQGAGGESSRGLTEDQGSLEQNVSDPI